MSALRRNVVFALWRLAAKIDTGHTLVIARTLTRVHEARQAAEHATVRIEISRALAQRLDGWSEPVQICFAETNDGWVMYVRSVEQVVIADTIAARAARQ
jgi:hypothetical protein